ncbi:MAG TPA: flagellar biosynthesis anti-sigma factor FlgM [Candidatus Sumerlaeota bacterium]|nr:flagellar biosynthesis anti-sigma factor FlgM [Candidatus Sumerlaeota bacterium]HOR29650.1 flagellar biosynthesis anti-sigma factor FlgM [Candidatus Sumerlaeota bacterium]HPK03029.1 flagellar biosynthesis anti-sigma factor FlgM [Candidatus Sumerlaeota bacterium]
MKIQGRKSNPVSPLGPFAGPPQVDEASPTASPAAGDSVELSSTRELQRLNQMAQAVPTVRLEKVEGLRDAIEEGSYYVESEKLARRVVDEALTQAILGKAPSAC